LGEEDFVEHGHPIVGADGRLKGYTLHLSIVTETKRLQEQMARANRLAAIGELAAGVAHNFGNVLMGVSATLDVLALKLPGVPGGEKLAPIVAGAQVQVSRGGDIIHRMLSLARGTPPVTGPVPIEEVVKDVLALANTHPAARSVTFSVDLPADLPPLLVAASELEEALLNLVINAVQACDESGKVTVAARRSRRDGSVEISVVDNGCGIPEEDLSRIFDPLVSLRCDGTLGTGLGLSTSLGLVTGMGGTIDVESRPAYGSTFTVVLPAARLEARAA
jgi:signal transduction histidine kinase